MAFRNSLPHACIIRVAPERETDTRSLLSHAKLDHRAVPLAAASGGRHWLADEEPELRLGVRHKLLRRLAQINQGRQISLNSDKIQSFIVKLEDEAFNGASSKDEYLRNISNRLLGIERKQVTVRQTLPGNAVQALQGGSSSVTAMPPAATITSQSSGLVKNQRSLRPCTPNVHIKVEQEQPDVMPVVGQYVNFQPITSTKIVPGVQPVQRPMQSSARFQNQNPGGSANSTGLNPTGLTKLQGHPVVRPNSQQNNISSQHASNIGRRQQQNSSGVNQQGMGIQRYQMLGAQHAGLPKVQIGYPGGQKNQQSGGRTNMLRSPLMACKSEPMTPTQQQITGGHLSSLLSQSAQVSATSGSSGEVDPKEEIFRKIKSWKDTYFSDFVEFDGRFLLPKMTQEQFRALPREKADEFMRRINLKRTIKKALSFLQLQKHNMPESLKEELPKYEKFIDYLSNVIRRNKARNEKMNTGHDPKLCGGPTQLMDCSGDAATLTGGKSGHEEKSADANILQSAKTIVTKSPPARQQKHNNHILGLADPSLPISSPGALQSLSTNKLEYLTPSSVANSMVAPVPSPSASIKSTLPPPIAKLSVTPVASPYSSVKSTSKDSDDLFTFLFHDNTVVAQPLAAVVVPKANGSNQVAPTNATTTASSVQAETAADQAKDQVCTGAEPPVDKKPIDRLIDAMRSSTPEALHSSVNAIWSVLSMSNIAPHGNIATSLGCFSLEQQAGSNNMNKMKRVFDHVVPHPESSMDASCMTFDCVSSDSGSSSEQSIKKKKTQHSKDYLLEEIKAINNTMIDTTISSMPYECGPNGITSSNSGTMIKLSYNAVSLSPGLKSLLGTSGMSLVMPVKLFIPADYPSSSPVLVNDEGDDLLRKKLSVISESVDLAFRCVLRDLTEPQSVTAIARAWDACVRNAVTELAQRHGGGTISSMLGGWERCAS